jgi:hypothetical protein
MSEFSANCFCHFRDVKTNLTLLQTTVRLDFTFAFCLKPGYKLPTLVSLPPSFHPHPAGY